MNVWTFTGNIGKDAEVRYTNAGKAICSFSVAVSSGWGENKKTTWAKCIMFGKRAEGGLVPYLTKGTQVAVSGEMTLAKWAAKDGTEQSTVEVVISELDLIGGKERSQTQENQPRQQAPAPPDAAQATDDQFTDDIPF